MNMNDAVTLSLAVVFVLVGLGIWQHRFERRVARLTRVEAKLDALMKHGGVVFDPYEGLPETVADAIRSGRKIEAVQLYRQITGVGLKTAVEAIDDALVRASSPHYSRH